MFFGIRDPGSEIRDPGSGIRDPGSGMEKTRIRDKHPGSATLVLTIDLDLLLSLYYWTGVDQILSQALLMVLPEGDQVNQELRILGLVLTIYTLLIQV